jgi:RNA polymerase sigma-70 factor (ECF subfamily)
MSSHVARITVGLVLLRMYIKPARAPHIPNLEEVVRTHWFPVFYFVLRWVHDRELAADLTQDCFWKACKGWKQFRGDSSVYTWLRHIAVNTINTFARNQRIQYWRRASLHDLATIEDLLPHPGPSPETSLFMSERLKTVWQAAELLPSRQQMAFVLRFGEEMELPEIAKSMKVTESAVKVHLFRAVQSLRKTVRRSQRTTRQTTTHSVKRTRLQHT